MNFSDLTISYELSALLSATASWGLIALNPCLNYVGRATDSRGDADGTGRAIQGAGAAFHAGVQIFHLRLFGVHSKNSMGADDFTHTAADAGLLIKL